MYLISIYFNEVSNRILQKHIDRIAEKTGNQFMKEHQVPPHLTLSSIEARSVDVLVPAFEKLRGQFVSGEIQFVSVGQLFPYVIYATPVLNEYLEHLSKQIYDQMSEIPETTISKLYRPYSWLPHVTLGKTLTKEQMQTAFTVLQEHFTPFTATVTEIGLAKVHPHEDVVRYRL